MRLAFMGFRHGHVMGLYKAALAHPGVEVVGACEEDLATAEALRREGKIRLTHERFEAMLAGVGCDAVAVGDYYGRRGEIVIAALEAGKHVIADKPLCTRRGELDRIAQLAAARKRSIGCLLDLRGSGGLRAMRRVIASGAIGPIHTVCFTAQHPLMFGSRPGWYFEPGRQGGTINDIAIHAVDAIPWITGRRFVEVVAARAWNARLKECPHFQDGAQLMLRMDNDGGVLGDVSYLAPDGCGYSAPQYWRITCHGAEGVIEFAGDGRPLSMAHRTDKGFRSVGPEPGLPNECLDAFLREVAGDVAEGSLTTADVLAASRTALLIQEAADGGLLGVPLV